MAFSAPVVTLLSAVAGRAAADTMKDIVDSTTGQTTGMQNLGTVKDSANQLARLVYDVSANTIYVQPL